VCPYTNFEVDLVLGEISNGPFVKTRESEVHTQNDQKKMFKCFKDAMDDLMNLLTQNITDFKIEDISKSELLFFGISAYSNVFSII